MASEGGKNNNGYNNGKTNNGKRLYEMWPNEWAKFKEYKEREIEEKEQAQRQAMADAVTTAIKGALPSLACSPSPSPTPTHTEPLPPALSLPLPALSPMSSSPLSLSHYQTSHLPIPPVDIPLKSQQMLLQVLKNQKTMETLIKNLDTQQTKTLKKLQEVDDMITDLAEQVNILSLATDYANDSTIIDPNSENNNSNTLGKISQYMTPTQKATASFDEAVTNEQDPKDFLSALHVATVKSISRKIGVVNTAGKTRAELVDEVIAMLEGM